MVEILLEFVAGRDVEAGEPAAEAGAEPAGQAFLAAEIDDVHRIVWHHEDGRMAKIKGRDFGIKRGSA